MSDINELKHLIKENLERRGLLDKLKTELKTEIFSILDEDSISASRLKRNLSNENLLINDLIREYLDFNRYNCTSNILVSETGQPKIIMNRKFLCDQLNVTESSNSKSVPLLYSLINYFTEKSSTKPLPLLVSKQRKPEEKRTIDIAQFEMDSGRSNVSDSTSSLQIEGMQKVYSARDFLRERSSYSSSNESRIDD